VAPLPETERKAFERGVAELSAIGRNLNQIARHLNQGGVLVGPRREDLALFIKVCTTLVGHLKATLKANKMSWEVGYESTDRLGDGVQLPGVRADRARQSDPTDSGASANGGPHGRQDS
jgi:hypothetical protein